jgi:hypothetical protein
VNALTTKADTLRLRQVQNCGLKGLKFTVAFFVSHEFALTQLGHAKTPTKFDSPTGGRKFSLPMDRRFREEGIMRREAFGVRRDLSPLSIRLNSTWPDAANAVAKRRQVARTPNAVARSTSLSGSRAPGAIKVRGVLSWGAGLGERSLNTHFGL